MLARSPSSPSTLKIQSMKSWPSMVSTARTAGFREDRMQCHWHDAVKCKQEGQAAFSHHTPHFPQDQVRPLGLCHDHNPPASIGNRGFVSAVGRDLTIGASRWLWSDRPLAVSSAKTSHLPNVRRGHSIRLGRRRGTYFQGARILILAWENMCSVFGELTRPLCLYVTLCRMQLSFRPQARGGIENIGDVPRTCLPWETCGYRSLSGVCGFPLPSHPSLWLWWYVYGVLWTGG